MEAAFRACDTDALLTAFRDHKQPIEIEFLTALNLRRLHARPHEPTSRDGRQVLKLFLKASFSLFERRPRGSGGCAAAAHKLCAAELDLRPRQCGAKLPGLFPAQD